MGRNFPTSLRLAGEWGSWNREGGPAGPPYHRALCANGNSGNPTFRTVIRLVCYRRSFDFFFTFSLPKYTWGLREPIFPNCRSASALAKFTLSFLYLFFTKIKFEEGKVAWFFRARPGPGRGIQGTLGDVESGHQPRIGPAAGAQFDKALDGILVVHSVLSGRFFLSGLFLSAVSLCPTER